MGEFIDMNASKSDLLTLILMSAFAFMLATALHEHAGHTLACVALGGKLNEIGAFYVDCDYKSLSVFSNRLVALAGPLVSLIIGIAGTYLFRRVSKAFSHLKYFLWLFSTINLMVATGYLLFSGVLGIGDFGMDLSGVFYQAQPEWIFRVGLIILGVASYIGVVFLALREMDTFIGGDGPERVVHAQRLSLSSYLAGGAAAVLIGLLNPHGIIIVLISSVASSLGGTSGLAWMMQLLNRNKISGEVPFVLQRNWLWVITSVLFLAIYAIVLGPTIFIGA